MKIIQFQKSSHRTTYFKGKYQGQDQGWVSLLQGEGKKTLKTISKIDTKATDVTMDLNDNASNTG